MDVNLLTRRSMTNMIADLNKDELASYMYDLVKEIRSLTNIIQHKDDTIESIKEANDSYKELAELKGTIFDTYKSSRTGDDSIVKLQEKTIEDFKKSIEAKDAEIKAALKHVELLKRSISDRPTGYVDLSSKDTGYTGAYVGTSLKHEDGDDRPPYESLLDLNTTACTSLNKNGQVEYISQIK